MNKLLLISAALLSLVTFSRAEAPRVIRESIEWCDVWVPHANESALPRVLLIGDSITRNYSQSVEELLKGKAYVARLATSRSIADPILLDEISLLLKQYKFSVIHFNNGMHGWDYTEEEYGAAYPTLVKLLQKESQGAKLICAYTTLVRVSGHIEQIDPKTERVKVRNQMVHDIVAPLQIPIDDLFAVADQGPSYFGNDGVHLNAKGSQALADQVTKSISDALTGK